MSDLAATNCGCGCDSGNNGLFNGSSCGCNVIWILLLLNCFCGNGNSMFNSCGNDSCLLILLLLFCCGGNGNGCGCLSDLLLTR